jgi:uncharacterized protein (DUF486 family)
MYKESVGQKVLVLIVFNIFSVFYLTMTLIEKTKLIQCQAKVGNIILHTCIYICLHYSFYISFYLEQCFSM